jgi:glycosyltransferase involved in cell wall biosynthesis
MARLSGRRDDQTVVIPLTSITADTAMLPPTATRHDDAVAFRLVQVASLSRVKNQRLVIDALAIVRHTINAQLHLVGEDTLGGELQRHADISGLGPYVTFHGFLSQPQVREVLFSADLYVQSSLHEAAGVSVLEAAAAGVPVVGTTAGYVADWSPLKAAAIGEATPDSLANAILALHADPDRRRSMAVAARDFAITHDAAWSAARFDDLYRSLKP